MKKLFSVLTWSVISLQCFAITPLWLRDVQISPDGTAIVFCYKGDVYRVNAQGGTAL